MTNEDIRTVRLIVNSESAAKELERINNQLETMSKKRDEAWLKGNQKDKAFYDKEIRRLKAEQSKIETRANSIERVLRNIDKATPKELKRTIAEINKELNSGAVQRGSEEWNTLTKSLRKANEELKKIKTETQAASEMKGWSDKIADWGFKWVGIISSISTGLETLSGIKQTATAAIEAYAKMQEAESDVRKYTGLTTGQVSELNEEFKQMDTRTSREQLNALAADAGRLGIQGKESVMEFVEAADMINIALGEDLGEDAVKNIGKLAQLFGDDDRMGLKGAMLATASTINDLGQTSSASEGYIVDFTGRLAGAGAQANMTQAQIMALGAVLDQSMVNAEEGSTALSKIIQKIYREPQKMAQAVGLDVKNFTELVKTDANEALLQFATAVSKMGGMEKIAPMLGDVSLTGAGVSKTLMALANDIDLVRNTQEQAARSFAEGTSVVNEFSVANNTVQAGLEKAKDRFNDLRVELGEKLIPVQNLLVGHTSRLINVLITLIEFGMRNARSIAYVTVALTAYTVAVNASVIADKAKVFWSNAVMASLKKLYAVLLAHPWAAMIAVVAAFVGYMQRAASTTDSMTAAARRLKRVTDEASAAVKGETEAMQSLLAVARDENRSKAERETAIRKLNELSPQYLSNLSLETINTDEATKATRRYINALLLKKKIEMAQEDIHELEKNQNNAFNEANSTDFLTSAGRGMRMAWDDLVEFASLPGTWYTNARAEYAQNAENLAAFYEAQKNNLKQNIETWTQELVSIEAEATSKTPPITEFHNNENTDNKGITAYERQRAELEIEYHTGLVSRDEYNKRMLQIDREYYTSLLALHGEGTKEHWDAQVKLAELQQKEKKINAAYSLREIEADKAEEERIAKEAYIRGEADERQYQDRMDAIRLEALKRRLEYERKYGDEKSQADAQSAYDDENLRQQMEKRKEFQKQVDEANREFNKLKEDGQKELYQLDGSADPLTRSFLSAIDAFRDFNTALKSEGGATWQDYAKIAQAAIGIVSAALSAASQLAQANFALEEAKINQRYDSEIKAAGNNTKKVKKLEEQRDKELKKAKQEANKKAMKIEIAQALASTALAAINAYASASKVNWLLGPIAAAMAVAAGGIQIAAIRKQHEAQAAGYYEGGYTGGNRYRREAGVVHEGEFVANHLAVNNPALTPVLNLIDHAQRNNTVASLTPSDVSRSVGGSTPATVIVNTTPTPVTVTESRETRDTLRRLTQTLEAGIRADVILDGERGLDRQWQHYNNLKNRR